MTPRDEGSRATGAGTPRLVLKEAPWHANKKVDMPQPKTPSVPPKRVAEPDAPVKDNKRNKMPSEPKDEPEEEDDTFRPDWSRDEDKKFDDAGDVFTIRDEKLIDGQRKITERKARFCVHCKTEVASTLKTCPNCAERPDGVPCVSTANSVGAVARALKPTIVKWVDRGGRGSAGNMRDDYKRRFRRATRLGFSSVLDRFQRDDANNFKFRCNMLANGWTEESIKEIDKIATAPGQPVPKAGQGRNWFQRNQSEGWFDRVDGHGAETERPIAERNVPQYVHERNAQRRAETALATGRLPEPGKGSSGYQEAKGKGPGKGKGQKRPLDHDNRSAAPEWASSAAWWTTAASTWWTTGAENGEPKDDAPWLFPVHCIFLLGAFFGGVVGYLVGYIRHYKVIFIPRPPRPQPPTLEAPRDRMPPILEAEAPRNRMPQVRVPDQVLITKTGGSFHHIRGCSSTSRGDDARSNKVLDRCGICYPPLREQ
jgi:hypothetical protein